MKAGLQQKRFQTTKASLTPEAGPRSVFCTPWSSREGGATRSAPEEQVRNREGMAGRGCGRGV